jgi:hypothetical protein
MALVAFFCPLRNCMPPRLPVHYHGGDGNVPLFVGEGDGYL